MIAGSCQVGIAAASSAHDDFETGKQMKHNQNHRNETHGLGLFNHYFVVIVLKTKEQGEDRFTFILKPL